jgi:hypothetical protein
MASIANAPRADLKATEYFLLTQEGVLDASVWYTEGDMVANIVVYDGMSVRAEDLQRACLVELGAHQTPKNIMLMNARRRIA